MTHWTLADIPRQDGRVAIVTGAAGGLGYETALALARAGAQVVLAGRNAARGQAAVGRLVAKIPAATVRFGMLDLASLASVAAFAGQMAAEYPKIDVLVNNAGVMALPTRQTTSDGFEMQLGTNYLGHFALTAHLLAQLRAGAARVVNLSSLAHTRGRIDFDDLQAARRYSPWAAYSQSKLAMLLFSFELQRRSAAGGWGVASIAAHPGWASTELFAKGPTAGTGLMPLLWRVLPLFVPLLGQSAAAGALPTLFAATSPDAKAGAYYGPDGRSELKGWPQSARIAPQGADMAAARRLWDVSEGLTGVTFRP